MLTTTPNPTHPKRGSGVGVRRGAARLRSEPVPVIAIPDEGKSVLVEAGGKEVRLTNLEKLFWPELGITKADLLRYYAGVATSLLPHLRDRAMVMKRYPHGAGGEFFFMKRTPSPRPEWLETCSITHGSGNVIDFPMVQDLAALLWVVNLGCIDLNPWYARCDDVNRPDFLHFDLDPTAGTDFEAARQTALLVHRELDALRMPNFPKTTGSHGFHIYVPIKRGPLQKQVWTFAKSFAKRMEKLYPDIITAEYRIEKRPVGHVLVDYNQNAWGRTLASVYSARPEPQATISAPVTWEEVAAGIQLTDLAIGTVPARLRELGDLWAPLAQEEGRFDLETVL